MSRVRLAFPPALDWRLANPLSWWFPDPWPRFKVARAPTRRTHFRLSEDTRDMPRKKFGRNRKNRCRFCTPEGCPRPAYVDYKDIGLLKKLCTNQSKMFSRKRSGNCAAFQRAVQRRRQAGPVHGPDPLRRRISRGRSPPAGQAETTRSRCRRPASGLRASSRPRWLNKARFRLGVAHAESALRGYASRRALGIAPCRRRGRSRGTPRGGALRRTCIRKTARAIDLGVMQVDDAVLLEPRAVQGLTNRSIGMNLRCWISRRFGLRQSEGPPGRRSGGEPSGSCWRVSK